MALKRRIASHKAHATRLAREISVTRDLIASNDALAAELQEEIVALHAHIAILEARCAFHQAQAAELATRDDGE